MIELEVVTPQRPLLKTLCASVILPGQQGEFQVLEGHAPLLAALKPGTLSYGEKKLMIAGGYAEVAQKNVMVMCEGAAWSNEIDLKSEQGLLEQLEAKLLQVNADDGHTLREIQAQIAVVMAKIRSI